jgi:hypothetical protein
MVMHPQGPHAVTMPTSPEAAEVAHQLGACGLDCAFCVEEAIAEDRVRICTDCGRRIDTDDCQCPDED